MTVIFPLMAAIGFRSDPHEPLHTIASDAAALHINAFAMDGFIDKILRRQGLGLVPGQGQEKEKESKSKSTLNPAAMLHLQKGLRLLRERLLAQDDDDTKLSDSTISTVVKLASAAHFDGDSHTARQHMDGLRKMVALRGGMDVFKHRKLQTEMLR
ncbi:hypothetical protein A1O3_00483 [Capronia epimyces CBS 606.96]|uniref:Uncharacterized protein n=1 Tax=Capronia epimyces CBS 606.96 TaxID=1182542 RepID=W9YHC8_9EURO|nr:uncharacterized protein A1O3_00483 [Capronia epimyces CBS 606.96]EXJ91933.1 hypothetical protein A1O3_00483 [Capronia epimyces CBS 606.96]